MRGRRTQPGPNGAWDPIPDPAEKFSSGIPDFDRLLRGGLPRGATALLNCDETVGPEDLDLLLFPTFLNFLYQSRGIVAVLPSRETPHGFRDRLTRFATRRRFDSRVRVIDYIGEDRGLPYVVNLADADANPIARKSATAKVIAAERQARGNRRHPILEFNAFEVFDTLMGSEKALKMFYYGLKRIRALGNLGVGVLAPGVGCAAGVRRMCDLEFAVHRDEVGLVIRGVRPSFPSHVVTPDPTHGAPRAAFVPRPA